MTLAQRITPPLSAPIASPRPSYLLDPVRLMSDDVFAAWMRADDRRRAEMMSAGKQRLSLSRRRR